MWWVATACRAAASTVAAGSKVLALNTASVVQRQHSRQINSDTLLLLIKTWFYSDYSCFIYIIFKIPILFHEQDRWITVGVESHSSTIFNEISGVWLFPLTSDGHTVDIYKQHCGTNQSGQSVKTSLAKNTCFYFPHKRLQKAELKTCSSQLCQCSTRCHCSAMIRSRHCSGKVQLRGGNCKESRCCIVAKGFCMVTYLHICTAFLFFFWPAP